MIAIPWLVGKEPDTVLIPVAARAGYSARSQNLPERRSEAFRGVAPIGRGVAGCFVAEAYPLHLGIGAAASEVPGNIAQVFGGLIVTLVVAPVLRRITSGQMPPTLADIVGCWLRIVARRVPPDDIELSPTAPRRVACGKAGESAVSISLRSPRRATPGQRTASDSARVLRKNPKVVPEHDPERSRPGDPARDCAESVCGQRERSSGDPLKDPI